MFMFLCQILITIALFVASSYAVATQKYDMAVYLFGMGIMCSNLLGRK